MEGFIADTLQFQMKDSVQYIMNTIITCENLNQAEVNVKSI